MDVQVDILDIVKHGMGVALAFWSGCGDNDNSTGIEDILNPAVTEDSPIDDSLAAIPIGSLEGQVGGVEGVQIDIQILKNGEAIASAKADAVGNYQIDNIEPGTYTVQITAKGHQAVELIGQVRADGVTSLDKVTLRALEIPVAHIRGLLLDLATREALRDVRVQLMDKDGNVREAVTGAKGVFAFENLPVDQQFVLTIDHDGYEKHEMTIDLIPANETAKVTIELMPIQEGEQLPAGDGLTVGTEAPDFGLLDENGKIHALADYAGQKVVILFDRGRW